MRNLLENAVKYGNYAYVTFTCDCEYIHITNKDDGPGIAEADQDRIFKPFVRLENSRCRETGGIGLGMAIARNIIHAHGGKIGLKNLIKGGLEITITIPS